MSRIAYRRIGYAIIHLSSKERRAKCKMTEKDRRELRGRCDRLENENGMLVLGMGMASNSKSRAECR